MALNKIIHDSRFGNPKKNNKFLVRDRQTLEILGGTDDTGEVYGQDLYVHDKKENKFINVKELITKGSDPELIRRIVIEEIAKAVIKPEQLVTGKLKKDVNITLVNGENQQLILDSGKGIYEAYSAPDDDPDNPDEDEPKE